MAKPGSGKKQMQSVRAKRWKATKVSLHKSGKALSSGSRAWKRGMKKPGGGRKPGPSPAPAERNVPDAPAPAVVKPPLSPAALKIRWAGVAAIAVGALLSFAVAQLGGAVILGGIVAVVGARKFGGEASDAE